MAYYFHRSSHLIIRRPQKLLSKPYTNSSFNSSQELIVNLNKTAKTLPKAIFTNYIFGITFVVLADVLYTWCRSNYNESLLNETIEKGNRPDVIIEKDELLPRPVIVEHLKKILLPHKNQFKYHVICG